MSTYMKTTFAAGGRRGGGGGGGGGCASFHFTVPDVTMLTSKANTPQKTANTTLY